MGREAVSEPDRADFPPVRWHAGTLLLAGTLGFLLITGVAKGLWLHHALTHYVVNPSWNSPSQARMFLGVCLIGPVGVLVTALLVGRSSRAWPDKVSLIARIGLLLAVLPWLFLMVSGVSV